MELNTLKCRTKEEAIKEGSAGDRDSPASSCSVATSSADDRLGLAATEPSCPLLPTASRASRARQGKRRVHLKLHVMEPSPGSSLPGNKGSFVPRR